MYAIRSYYADNHWIPLGTAFGKVISPSVAVFNGGMQFDSMNSRENLENVGSALVSHEFTDSRGVNDYSMGRFSFSLISQYGATTNRLKVLFC